MGVSPSQPKQSSGAVFGDVAAQTNGASKDNKEPFGFCFTKPQEPQQQASNPSQNLFIQCMSQTQTQSPGITQGQSKDTNYFTALAKNVSKEPPTLFKPAAASDGLKKAVVASASAGLFGSAPTGGIASIKDQPKVPDVKPAGNGLLINKSFGAGGDTLAKLTPGFPPPVTNNPVMSSGDISKPALGPVTSLSLGTTALTSPGAVIRNAASVSPASGFGLLSGSKGSEPHENLFLAASKEANPFLAYSGAVSNSPFSGLTTSNLPSSVSVTQPAGDSGVLSQDAPTTNNQSNLFTMVEPPKGILSSQFASCSSSSSPASIMSQHKDEQVLDKEATNGGTGAFNTESVFAEGQAAATLFDQGSQKFSLDERGQSSKRDSDTSTNSDLSDLSEAEDSTEQTQKPGMHPGSTDGPDVQKTKAQAAKNRQRSKPFKGNLHGSLGFSFVYYFVRVSMVIKRLCYTL